MDKMPESEWQANYWIGTVFTDRDKEMEIAELKNNLEIRMKLWELDKNPFYNATDVDIALTSAGYVSWRAVEELKK